MLTIITGTELYRKLQLIAQNFEIRKFIGILFIVY